MDSLKEFRLKARITQLSLAGYLGVSKSLIWHAENGTRELPDEAWARLKDLLVLMDTKQSSDTFIPANCVKAQNKKLAEAVGKAKDGIRDCKINMYSARKRLQQVKKAHEATLTAFKLLHYLEEEAGKNVSIKRQKPWMDYYRAEIKMLHRNNCSGTQAMLELRLSLQEAKAKVYEDFINKYG